ncbi:MAG: DUF5009 domain-containing protein [Janthinobacterium lividum]
MTAQTLDAAGAVRDARPRVAVFGWAGKLDTMPAQADVLPSSPESVVPSATVAPRKARIESLDIFRGLNLALMIFVNELAEVKGLPWWTYHAPGRVDAMTYVDMVFPGFLLIVGMSLPLALGSRVRRGDGPLQMVGYIVLRSGALLALGIVIANAGGGSPALMHGLPPYAWGLLATGAAVLVWLDYATLGKCSLPILGRKSVQWLLRGVGLVGLLALALMFQRVAHDGGARWLSYDYPEILGLIGYTYFAAGLCYLLTRRWRWAPVGWFIVFVVMNALDSAKILHKPGPWWVWPLDNGALLSLVFAGVVLSTIFFLEPRLATFRAKATAALGFAVACAVTAMLLTPLGISKIRATPTWVLYTVAACCALYTLLYWICDVRKHTRWAAPVRSAGSNTLLTYLLPDVYFFVLALMGVKWFATHLATGWPGVLRAVVFTAAMLGVSTLLTRMRLRLQL